METPTSTYGIGMALSESPIIAPSTRGKCCLPLKFCTGSVQIKFGHASKPAPPGTSMIAEIVNLGMAFLSIRSIGLWDCVALRLRLVQDNETHNI